MSATPGSSSVRLARFCNPPVSWIICWEALAQKPACIRLNTDDAALHITGCPAFGEVPFADQAQPWQLAVSGKGLVTSFPTSQACSKASYLLQNKAAKLAGWTEEQLTDKY